MSRMTFVVYALSCNTCRFTCDVLCLLRFPSLNDWRMIVSCLSRKRWIESQHIRVRLRCETSTICLPAYGRRLFKEGEGDKHKTSHVVRIPGSSNLGASLCKEEFCRQTLTILDSCTSGGIGRQGAGHSCQRHPRSSKVSCCPVPSLVYFRGCALIG